MRPFPQSGNRLMSCCAQAQAHRPHYVFAFEAKRTVQTVTDIRPARTPALRGTSEVR